MSSKNDTIRNVQTGNEITNEQIQLQQTDIKKNQMNKMSISQTDVPFSSFPLDCQCYRQEQRVIPHHFCRHLLTLCRFPSDFISNQTKRNTHSYRKDRERERERDFAQAG